jgi:hypothetical protein
MLDPAQTEHLEGVTVGFVEDAEDTDGVQFLVVAVLPDRSVSLRFVADVDQLLRKWGRESKCVPVAVFQADREAFADAAGIDPVFPQTVDFGWAASALAKAPVVPEQRVNVVKHLARLDTKAVAQVLRDWAEGAPAPAPRLSYRQSAEQRVWDEDNWRDYLDD